MIKNYNVDLASLSDQKLKYDFAKAMDFDKTSSGNQSTRDRTPIKLHKSPGLMISASGISYTIFLSSNPNELGKRLKLLVKKQGGIESNISNQEMVTINDNLLENKCITPTQHKKKQQKI